MRTVMFFLAGLISSHNIAIASEDWLINAGGTMRGAVVTAPSGLNKPALLIAKQPQSVRFAQRVLHCQDLLRESLT